MENNKIESAFNLLAEVVVEEYKSVKKELEYQKNRSESLASWNEALRITEQKNAEAFARLKKLIAPSITWFEGKPFWLTGVTAETLSEICEILKIEGLDKGKE